MPSPELILSNTAMMVVAFKAFCSELKSLGDDYFMDIGGCEALFDKQANVRTRKFFPFGNSIKILFDI